MGLQLVIGSSGSGKTNKIYSDIVEESLDNVKNKYLAIVPEQFTMETQKQIVKLSPVNGTMNIDILSFDRLAQRIFEEAGMNTLQVLDDTGKCLILRKIIEQNKKEFSVFGSKVKMSGFIDEMKSMISELFQYGIGKDKLNEMLNLSESKPLLYAKLKDISLITEKLNEYLKDRFTMNEELLSKVCELIPNSNMIKNSYITLDEYTGFSPVQYNLLGLLMKHSRQVTIAVTVRDSKKTDFSRVNDGYIFSLPVKTINKLLKIAKENDIKVNKTIYSDDFKIENRFSKSEALSFLEENIFKYSHNQYLKYTDDISIHVCKNNSAEAEFVAVQINKLIRENNYRYKDIAVVTPDIESYYRSVHNSFEKYDIPCFIDHKRSVITNPMVEAIRAVMEIATDNYSYESVFRYLRSSMSSLTRNEIDLLENYVIMNGVRGINKWTRQFKTDDEIILTAKQKVLDDTLPVYEVFKGELAKKNGVTVKDAITTLYEFVKRLNISEKLRQLQVKFSQENNLSLAKEYDQTFEKVMELFDKTVYLIGDEYILAKDLLGILDSGFEEIKVGIIPPTVDKVVVGDIERTRLSNVKTLFLIGVNDGLIPKVANGSGVLSQSERNFLYDNDVELSPTSREDAFIQKYYLYLMLTKMSDKLYLSFKRSNNDGSAARQSYLIGLMCKLFPKISISDEENNSDDNSVDNICNIKSAKSYIAENIFDVLSEKDKKIFMDVYSVLINKGVDLRYLINAAVYENKNTKLDRAVAKALYGENLINSVSRLETFAACAYRHFILYGLALVERKKYETSSADIGNIYHETLKYFFEKMDNNEADWKTLDDAAREKLVDECVDIVKEEYNDSSFTDNARNSYMIERIRKMSKKTAWALHQQIKAGDFVPKSYELKFSSTEGLSDLNFKYENGTMGIKGVIDRVDYYNDGDDIYIKIVDYKSGNKKFEINDVYNGLQLQLVLYMEAAQLLAKKKFPNKNINPAGLFYYNINDPVIDKESIKDNSVDSCILKELKVNGVINGDNKVVCALDNIFKTNTLSISSDVVPIAYKKDGSFTASSGCITPNDFESLVKYVHDIVGELGGEILDGKIDVNPFAAESGKTSTCEYCKYNAVCGFDRKIKGFEYRKLNNLSSEQEWEDIRKNSLEKQKGEE